jgi:hypothetical protein
VGERLEHKENANEKINVKRKKEKCKEQKKYEGHSNIFVHTFFSKK